MICQFTTGKLPIASEALLANPLLGLSGKFDVATGETFTDRVFCEKQYLKWSIKEGRPFLSGNLHKFFTNNIAIGNSTQFDINQIRQALDLIENDYQITTDQTYLRSFEFAVNITGLDKYGLTTETMLDSFIMHEQVRFSKVKKTSRHELTAEHGHYTLKCYDKQKQYPNQPHALRFETHLAAMEPVKSVGVKTLADFSNREKLLKLGEILAKKVDGILYLDPKALENPNITTKQKEKLLEGARPEYWEGLQKENAKDIRTKRRRYKMLVNRLAERSLAEILKTEIKNHVENLMIEMSRFKPLDKSLNRVQNTITDATLNRVQNQFSEWGVDELAEYFSTVTLPKLPVRLTVCENILDPEQFVACHLAELRGHSGINRYFKPSLSRLRRYAELLQASSN
jgi:hypothetical protein